MDRTSGLYYTVNPVTGKREFTNGPPGTRVEEIFLNGVQEELVGIIESTSGIVSATDNTQVIGSLGRIINSLENRPRLVWKNDSTITITGDPYYLCASSGWELPRIMYLSLGTLDWTWVASGTYNKGLDTGVEQNSKWYYLYGYYDGTNPYMCVIASLTAPTSKHPSVGAFDTTVYLGAFYNDSAGNIWKFIQNGNRVYLNTDATISWHTATGIAYVETAIDVPESANIYIGVFYHDSASDSAVGLVSADGTHSYAAVITLNTVVNAQHIIEVPVFLTQKTYMVPAFGDTIGTRTMGWVDKYL